MLLIPTFGELLRAARRHVDFSQRELALAAGVPKSTVAAYETEERDVPARMLARLLGTCGLRLAVVDGFGTVLDFPDEPPPLDRGGRRYPAHLDLRDIPAEGRDRRGFPIDDWWADGYEGAWGIPPRPARTFDILRDRRDFRRRWLAARAARHGPAPPQ